MASTPQTVASSPAGSPEALTIVSSSSQQTPQTISSDPPELALVGEVIQIPEEDAEEQSERSVTQGYVSSSSEDVEVLEAQAETARARVREAEVREKLARARRSRTASSRGSVQSISSARFSEPQATQQVPVQAAPAHVQVSQPVLPVQPDTHVHVQHAQHVTDSRDAQPVRPNWLDWFSAHAPLSGQHVQDGTNAVEPGGSAGVSRRAPGLRRRRPVLCTRTAPCARSGGCTRSPQACKQ